jgi:hypothetical protein
MQLYNIEANFTTNRDSLSIPCFPHPLTDTAVAAFASLLSHVQINVSFHAVRIDRLLFSFNFTLLA